MGLEQEMGLRVGAVVGVGVDGQGEQLRQLTTTRYNTAWKLLLDSAIFNTNVRYLSES